MHEQDNTDAQDLADLLEREKRAILDGDFAALPPLIAAKTRFAEATIDLNREEAVRLQRAASENQRLLTAALRGVRSAADRLSQIAEGARGYTGYDRNGQATPIRRTEGKIEHRA